jgi:hypothetical protein
MLGLEISPDGFPLAFCFSRPYFGFQDQQESQILLKSLSQLIFLFLTSDFTNDLVLIIRIFFFFLAVLGFEPRA